MSRPWISGRLLPAVQGPIDIAITRRQRLKGMDLRFHIDPQAGDLHIYRHGVREDEVEDVMSSPAEDLPG